MPCPDRSKPPPLSQPRCNGTPVTDRPPLLGPPCPVRPKKNKPVSYKQALREKQDPYQEDQEECPPYVTKLREEYLKKGYAGGISNQHKKFLNILKDKIVAPSCPCNH